jgi:flagellar hook assembly protein FlgD
MEGNLIRSISVGYVDAGSYVSRSEAIYWDGKADTGEKVASGTYFYALKTHRSVFTQKMIILK